MHSNNNDSKVNSTIIPIPVSIPTSERTPLFIGTKDSTFEGANTNVKTKSYEKYCLVISILLSLVCLISFSLVLSRRSIDTSSYDYVGKFDGKLTDPFSIENPLNHNALSLERPWDTKPGSVLTIAQQEFGSLPTNAWCENMFVGDGNTDNNRVYQIPYVVDAAGPAPGIRTNTARLLANTRVAEMAFEPMNGLILSAVEPLEKKYKVVGNGQKVIGRLFLTLEWQPKISNTTLIIPNYKMQAHIVRGSPYISTKYINTSPAIRAQRSLLHSPIIDGNDSPTHKTRLTCGDSNSPNAFSNKPVRVNEYIQLRFYATDMTWIVFFSEPVEVVCASTALEEFEVTPYFELRVSKPMKEGLVRVAMVNNCTSGTNPIYCIGGKPRNTDDYKDLLIKHSSIYPTAQADIEIDYPNPAMKSTSTTEEKYQIKFNWKPANMRQISNIPNDIDVSTDVYPDLLMFGVPHHQQLMKSSKWSLNDVLSKGCQPTLHGLACPVIGSSWVIEDVLYPVTFGTEKLIRPEMIADIKKSLQYDIGYEIPFNYRNGAGDTYFSGKMLAKLGRIILVADAMKAVSKTTQKDEELFQYAIVRLKQATEIWLNGSAGSPFIYDREWGGLSNCGCNYNGDTQLCDNVFPDCPGLGSVGMNFGFSYYNDHHFHLGYHIFAAAVASKYDHVWAKKYFQKVLLFIRDIANPSTDDPYFTTYRHTDWYLGFAWASGIVVYGGQPYLNGRNWESSSEAVAAYESVALYGDVMSNVFDSKNLLSHESEVENKKHQQVALRVKAIGRVLTSTCIRAAKSYFHISSPETVGVKRIYPDIYSGKVVGMMWSMKFEQQTWFGNEPWKSFGIQMLPLTQITQYRDDKAWLTELIPSYNESCRVQASCNHEGFSVVMYSALAMLGNWKGAREGIQALGDEVFFTAGGNGHSRSNSLWFIATRE